MVSSVDLPSTSSMTKSKSKGRIQSTTPVELLVFIDRVLDVSPPHPSPNTPDVHDAGLTYWTEVFLQHDRLKTQPVLSQQTRDSTMESSGEEIEFGDTLGWAFDYTQFKKLKRAKETVKVKVLCRASPSSPPYLVGEMDLCVSKADIQMKNGSEDDDTEVFKVKTKPLQGGYLDNNREDMKPRIKIGMMVKGVQRPSSRPTTSASSSVNNIEDENSSCHNRQQLPLHPVHRPDQGYFLLGTETDATQLFALKIKLISGDKLASLLPSYADLSPGFHFSLDLFGFPLQTAPTSGLPGQDMDVESIEVKIASNERDVLDFFKNYAKPFEIFVLSGETRLGVASLDVAGLLDLGDVQENQDIQFDHTSSTPFRPLDDNTAPAPTASLRFSLDLRHVRPLTPPPAADVHTQNNNLSMNTLPGASSQSVLEENTAWKRRLEDAVVDVEKWKVQQKKKFMEKAEQRDSTLSHLFSSEWQRRDEERERALQLKMEEMDELSKQLRATIGQLEKREAAVKAREEGLEKREQLLTNREDTLRQSQRNSTIPLKRKLTAAESDVERLTAESTRHRQAFERLGVVNRQTLEDVSRLRVEVEKVRAGKMEMERDNERLKQRLNDAERETRTLRDEKVKLMAEQLEYYRERQEQVGLMEQKMARRGQQNAPQQQHGTEPVIPPSPEPSPASEPTDNMSTSERQKRLLFLRKQRETLLNSKSYQETDAIIKNLDEKISQLLD